MSKRLFRVVLIIGIAALGASGDAISFIDPNGHALSTLLDGNMYFSTASTRSCQSLKIPAPVASPAVIVGVGYPTEKPDEVMRPRPPEPSVVEKDQWTRQATQSIGGTRPASPVTPPSRASCEFRP